MALWLEPARSGVEEENFSIYAGRRRWEKRGKIYAVKLQKQNDQKS